MPVAQRLEECLRYINNHYDNLIDKLIEYNNKTLHKVAGCRRLIPAPVDIAQGILVSKNVINTQALERPEKSPLLLHMIFDYEHRTSWKIVIPLQYLLKGWGDASQGHQCYVHTIARNIPKTGTVQQLIQREADQSNNYTYVGITGRNWLLRLSEHLREIHNGSRRTFYQAWRDNMGLDDVLYVSQLSDINLEYEEAMNWEETFVDLVASGPNGLNMIPGGFKGLKYLHKLGITKRERISLKERDVAIENYIRRHPRKGIPNPFISKLWESDNHYLRVMAARPKTLSPDQVRRIRDLKNQGWSIPEILEDVGAINEAQVRNVLSGRTYKRMH